MAVFIDCECNYRNPLPEHATTPEPHCRRCNGRGTRPIPDPELNLTDDADFTERAQARQFASTQLRIGADIITALTWSDLRKLIAEQLHPTP